jgi:hypothetical protein
MRRALATLFVFALMDAAFAADAPAAGDKAGKPGTNVDMPYLMAPMSGADGKLAGYAYISSRLAATSDTNAVAVRNKLAFIQDAFVRDVNGVSVAKADDATAVDQPALQARLLADARKVMGANAVSAIALVQVQIAPLHPTQTPPRDTPVPPADSVAKPAQTAKSGE